MDRRAIERRDFLLQAGWHGAQVRALAGDASDRRYFRLDLSGHMAILMDCPPAGAKGLAAFVRIGQHLNDLGLSAPRLICAGKPPGFLLLEDFGDGLFSSLLDQGSPPAERLYSAATDVLIHLHDQPPPAGLLPLDAPEMGNIARMLVEWYSPAAGGPDGVPILAALVLAAERLTGGARMLMLRDYHAGNLIWLPARVGVARVGLLDFQDAMVAHPAYDLVSLLQDARRDVPPGIEAAMVARYCTATGQNPQEFAAAYAMLGCQRAMRIMGVFVRLCLVAGKPGYLAHMPRVWRYLQRNLAHPALCDLANLCHRLLPEPTPERLARIKDRCATIPKP